MTTTSSTRKIAPESEGSRPFRNVRQPYGALHMELSRIHQWTIYVWPSRHLQIVSSSFVGQLWQCLVQLICDNQMKKTQPESLHKMQREDFLGCLVASIACIRLGRIACLLGRGCTKAAMGNAMLSLKLSPITTCGFGILSLEWREPTMTSMYGSDLLCSQD
jgi:hypothetical protein